MNLIAVFTVAIILTASCFGQSSHGLEQKPFVVEDIRLDMTLQRFHAKMPSVQCDSYFTAPQSKTCTLLRTIRFGGVRSSKANFNFDAGLLTNISLWFYPAPSDQQIQQMMESLKKDYGMPTKLIGASGETLWEWNRTGSRMILTMPYPSWNQVDIDISSLGNK